MEEAYRDLLKPFKVPMKAASGLAASRERGANRPELFRLKLMQAKVDEKSRGSREETKVLIQKTAREPLGGQDRDRRSQNQNIE